MPFFQRICPAAIALACLTTTFAQNTAYTLELRPDLQAPFLNITLHVDPLVTPGYLFLAPYQTNQDNVYIYDNRGNLVYSGFGPSGGGIYHNFHVCPINGTDFLCFFNGNQFQGFSRGHGVIMDNTLSFHSTVQGQGAGIPNDQHEFNVVDGGESVLMSIYDSTQYELSEYGIEGQGWGITNYFQKVKIDTNELVFEWSAADHVNVTDSYIKPNTTDISGTGLSQWSPFDWFHLNSVDQFPDGDFLVSSRHCSTIYRVSGKDGGILWRLGGVSSDFSFAPGLNFSFQHDARLRYQNKTHTIISIFDNASNGYNQSSRYSSGKVLSLDHTANYCSLLSLFISPYQFISPSQGNVQVLSDLTFEKNPQDKAWQTSNFFIGWGSNAYISEHLADGKMIFQGHFATTGSMAYRSFKYNFTTYPTDAPASYTYTHNTSAPTIFYMSWNGATQAAKWRIYTSHRKQGPFEAIATVKKVGFETVYTAPHYHAWSIIESLDADGKHLRNSTRPLKTFMPGPSLAGNCNALECPAVTDYNSTATATVSTGKGSAAGPAKSGEPEKNAAGDFRRGRAGLKIEAWIGLMCSIILGIVMIKEL